MEIKEESEQKLKKNVTNAKQEVCWSLVPSKDGEATKKI